jgi:hypothetical protein
MLTHRELPGSEPDDGMQIRRGESSERPERQSRDERITVRHL